jgi:hypothetical protein
MIVFHENNIRMNNKLKKNLSDLKSGVIKVYKTPTLPHHVQNINNRNYMRIFRVLGGVCLLLTISKKVFDFNEYIIYLTIFIDVLFLIYQFILQIYRIRNIYRILRSNKLDIRNSPLNKFATIFTKGLLCVKGVCEGGIFTGTLLGTGIAYDWALEAANREKVFAPLVGKFIQNIIVMDSLTPQQMQQLEELRLVKKTTEEKMEQLKTLNNIIKSNQEVENIINNIECQKDIFTEQDKNSLLMAFKEEKAMLVSKSKEIRRNLNMDDLLKSFNNKEN